MVRFTLVAVVVAAFEGYKDLAPLFANQR